MSSFRTKLRNLYARPVVAPLLRSRVMCIVLAMVGLAQVVSTYFHVGVYDCPIASVIQAPCPGCGVSRGCAEILHGHFRESIHFHLFSICFLLAIGIFTVAVFLPDSIRDAFSDRLDRFERRSLISSLLLTGIFLYWIARLIYYCGRYGELFPVSQLHIW